MSWQNFDVDFLRTAYAHMVEFYPLKWKDASWIHTSVIANLLHSLFKSMIGDIAYDIGMGVTLETYQGRLNQVFQTPTPEIALERLFARYQQFLTHRYRRQHEFRLPSKGFPPTSSIRLPALAGSDGEDIWNNAEEEIDSSSDEAGDEEDASEEEDHGEE